MTVPSPSKRSAFSLIELMVVLAVVGLLLAFAAPNLFSLISANTLTGEGTLLRNQFTYAQQIAVSKSADVEVRFFKFKDSDSARTEESFGAYQLFQYNQDGDMAPVSTLFRIRAPVAINERLSPLLDPSANSSSAKDRKFGYAAPTTGHHDVPTGRGGDIVSTEYVSFRFRPDGSTDLPNRSKGGDTWYITLVQGEGAIEAERPSNFVCLQVNPYNGQIGEFRP